MARKGRALSDEIRFSPYYDTKRKAVRIMLFKRFTRRALILTYSSPTNLRCTAQLKLDGTAMPSMTGDLIEANMDDSGNVKDEELIASMAGAVYIGGSETVRD